MSFPLILTILLALGSLVTILINPVRMFRFDCACALLMLGYIIPEQYVVESSTFSRSYDITFTWWWILACQAAIYLGFLAGRTTVENNTRHTTAPAPASYDLSRISLIATAMVVFGGIGFVLMARLANEFEGQQWTGVITLYYLISQFLLFGGVLSWLLYLRSRNPIALFNFLIFLAVATLVVLVFVRRGIAFQAAFATLGGLYFVRRYVPPRWVMIGSLLLGAAVLNSAGAIREHISRDKGTFVTAFTSGAVLGDTSDDLEKRLPSSEVKSAVSDIEIARSTGEYKPFQMLWNLTVLQWVPGFIVGPEVKLDMMIDDDDEAVMATFEMRGSTRTGFSEAYTGYWYFGVLIFFAISAVFGRLWENTLRGDLRAQFLYLLLINSGLLIITESVSRLIVTLPLILGTSWLVFALTRRKAPSARTTNLAAPDLRR